MRTVFGELIKQEKKANLSSNSFVKSTKFTKVEKEKMLLRAVCSSLCVCVCVSERVLNV